MNVDGDSVHCQVGIRVSRSTRVFIPCTRLSSCRFIYGLLFHFLDSNEPHLNYTYTGNIRNHLPLTPGTFSSIQAFSLFANILANPSPSSLTPGAGTKPGLFAQHPTTHSTIQHWWPCLVTGESLCLLLCCALDVAN